jgi:hypothetical protein
MADGEDQGWLEDETDPFAESTPPPTEDASDDFVSEKEGGASTAAEENVDQEEAETEPLTEPSDENKTVEWGLPIRAAPLLAQEGDIVTEYPLKQSTDGRKTTSIVVDEELLRVVDTELGDDGHRRMKVRLTVKQGITGFNHQHNELMHQHQFLWIGCFVIGFGLALTSSIAFGVLGALAMIIGIRSWTLMHLETHHLQFSNQGGSHALEMRAYGTNRGFFRASMAMIGPVMADFIRTGTMDVEALENLHESLLAPPTAPISLAAPLPLAEPMPPHSEPESAQVQPPLPIQIPPVPSGPPATTPRPPAPVNIPPPPSSMPTPAPPIAAQIPPPPPAPMPVAASLPPAPMPPPMPLPLPPTAGLASMPAPLPAPGMPLPLDAPLPAAPQVAVEASPVEETLSEDEQNELLNELS